MIRTLLFKQQQPKNTPMKKNIKWFLIISISLKVWITHSSDDGSQLDVNDAAFIVHNVTITQL